MDGHYLESVYKVGKNQKNKYIAHFNLPVSPLKWEIIEFIFLIFHNFSSLKETFRNPYKVANLQSGFSHHQDLDTHIHNKSGIHYCF